MAPHKKLRKLTAKQQAFVEAYLSNGGNGTQAAITAGYSQQTATITASDMLLLPHIQAELGSKRGTAVQKLDLGVEPILSELKRIAFAEPRSEPTTKTLDEVWELERIYQSQAGRVAELSRVETQTKEHSLLLSSELKTLAQMAARLEGIRSKALEKLGEFFQLFNRHTVNNTTNNIQVNNEMSQLSSKELAALARTQMKPVDSPQLAPVLSPGPGASSPGPIEDAEIVLVPLLEAKP